MSEKFFTIIKDGEGNEIIVPQSHRNVKHVQTRIAEEMIKAHNLNCTVEEYFQRCKEYNGQKIEVIKQSPPCVNLTIIPAKRRG